MNSPLPPRKNLWIAKLGGSLADSPYLPAWLDALAEHGAGRVVLVPGGGPFADAVRGMQARRRFDDASAHAMALLAMQQYGWMLRGLCPQLVLESDVERLRERLAEGACVVWLPDLRQLDAAGVPASWDITSDSLAAWLAGRIGAGDLLMIKSVAVAADATLDTLQAQGVVDPAFAGYCRAGACRLHWLTPPDSGRLAGLLRGGQFQLADLAQIQPLASVP